MFLLNIILSNAACAFLVLIFLLIVGISSYVIIRNNRKVAEVKTPHEKPEITETIEFILKELNCRFKREQKDAWNEYNVKFQSGNFIIIFKNEEDFVRIHYPRFFTTSIENIHIIRQVCNECNTHNFSHHLVYTMDGKENDITVHITSSCTLMEDNTKNVEHFADVLSHVFSIAQDFYIHFERNKEKAREIRTFDIEEDYATYEREFFLLKEGEITVYDNDQKYRTSEDKPLTISFLLKQFYDWTSPELLELKIINHTTKTILTEEEIANYDISSALVAKDSDGQPQFIGRNATLTLIYSENKNSREQLPSLLTIALQSEGRTPEILYMRATLCRTPDTTHNKNALEMATTPNLSNSFVFAYDTTNAEQKKAELKFLMDELNEKVEAEKFDELTPEEQIIYNFKMPNMLENIHYGESLYRQKRYYEAIVQLESVYNFLNKFFHSLDKKQKQYFYDICYYIGACYSKIGLYKKGYYYLDAVFSLNNFTYMEEYVNCLVNCKDHRTLGIIDNLSNFVDRKIEESIDDEPDYLLRFKKFLLRRKAHVLISIGALDAAQNLCESMLRDPDNQDFALNDLAYIQKLYEQASQQEQDSEKNDGADSVDTDNTDKKENI